MDSPEDLDDNSKQFSDEVSDEETLNEGLLGDVVVIKEKVCYQKEIIDNKLLPYAHELDDEANALFAKIKANLGRCVILRKITQGAEFWSDMVQRYIKLYDLRFTKEDHIALIKLFYELITIPNLESSLVASFGYTLIVLLRKSDLISPKELELPWKPLYQLCRDTICHQPLYILLNHFAPAIKSILETLIYAAKIYFPVNATQEILDEMRPQLCAFNHGITRTTIKIFEWFLPVQLTPEYHSTGFKLWFDELMTLWKNCTMLTATSNLMHLFSDLAHYNVGYIDWEPYMPLMFTRFVQSFNLPVNYKNVGCKNNLKLSARHIGIWIASTLGNKSSSQVYLDKFLKTIETYFHPANFGFWLVGLEELFMTLSKFVVIRLYRERHQKTKANKPRWKQVTPDSHKLTDADVDAFVNSMMPIVMIGIFNKRCNALFEALNYLALLRPNMVIPSVLEKIYPTLGSEIEPHKQITAFNCIISVARPLVQGPRYPTKEYAFEDGPLYVLPLLFSSLEGIDPNDQTKCLATFRFIQIYVSMIPIVDCSKSQAEMSEEERLVCEETSRFEDFVLQLMSKVFTLIESSTFESVRLENSGSNVKSQSHSKIELELNLVFLTLLRQSSRPIFLSALNKLRSFILESTLEIHVSGRLVGTLCEAFAHVNGPETLKALLPFLAERILEYIDEEDVLKAEHLDNQVLYPLLLLCRLVLTQGDVLVPYEDNLLKIVDKAIHLKSLEGNELGCVLLTNILQALANVNPVRVHRNLDDPEYLHVRDWGEPVKIKSVQFYVPGKNELEAMQRIFKRYLMPAVDTLENFIKTGNSLSREDLQRTLRIVSYIVKGCNGFLPLWAEPTIKNKLYEETDSFEPVLGIKGEIQMPDGRNARKFLVQLMTRLQEVMLKNVEDDTKSFFALQMVWLNTTFGRMHIEPGFKYLAHVNSPFRVVKNKMTGCKGWFAPYMMARVYSLHCLRKQYIIQTFTETHKTILMNLFKLSISHYPGVRIKAQELILSGLAFFPEAYESLTPEITEVLRRDPTVHHEAFKGILYLLVRPSNDQECLLVTRDWEFIRTVWPAIAASGNSEKPSVIRLKKAVIEALSNNFYTFNIKLEVPDCCISAAGNLWKTGMKPNAPPPTVDKIQEGIEILKKIGENNLKLYNETLEELLKILLEKSKIWSDRAISMHFIYMLMNAEVVVPASIVRFFLNSLIHETVSERNIAIRVMPLILKQLKKKHAKVKIENPSTSLNSSGEKIVSRGSRADNAWLQYNFETRPTSAAAWDELRYVHKTQVGYYSWPRELEVYAPSSAQPAFNRADLIEQELEIVGFFEEQANVDKLIEYLSLEGKKVLEKFDEFRRLLFKGLFRNYGDMFLSRFLPHLHRLVADKQNTSQRCAAEIIAGLVQGSKHWTYEMVENMWRELLPILRIALSHLTGETIAHWQACMLHVCRHRDPNRLHWLLEFLLEEAPCGQSAEASIAQYGRIMVLQSALLPIAWKSVQLLRRTLQNLESRMEQRLFRTVRDALVTTLNLIFNENLELADDPECPNSAKFIDKFYPKFQSLLEKDEDPSTSQTDVVVEDSNAMELSSASTSCSKEMKDENGIEAERENKIRLFKIVCMWMYCAVKTSSLKFLSSYYKLLPLMCQLESDDKDEELSKMCTTSIGALAHALHHPEHVPAALEAVKLTCRSTSWSTRANCLEFLQVLVFHNMSFFLSNHIWVSEIQEIVLRLLEDERIEVREKAAKLLGGLLHCTIIPDQESLLEELKKKARTRLGKKKRPISGEEDSGKFAKAINAARVRHASVLGMCAFIRAYPYDIPRHVPPIFECLSIHLNDPEPIPSTIHKTVNEFKRTHCDGWTGLQGLADKFTKEQFAVLQDLTVPPSYYA